MSHRIPTHAHPSRCTCAYCRQAHAWQPMTIILRMEDWEWIMAQGGTLSSTVEGLVRRARAEAA